MWDEGKSLRYREEACAYHVFPFWIRREVTCVSDGPPIPPHVSREPAMEVAQTMMADNDKPIKTTGNGMAFQAIQGTRELLFLRPDHRHFELIPSIQAAGWSVRVVHSFDEAMAYLGRRDIQVGLVHLEEPQRVQQELLELWCAGERMEWVALLEAAHIQSSEISRLITEYFYDYHTLPADLERLLFSLGHAYGMASMSRNWRQRHELKFGQHVMIGSSAVMQRLVCAIHRVANVDVPVLISGEPGTGKGLTARAIHALSSRSQGPFVAVDCRALSVFPLGQCLFGYEKGGFPGAQARRAGYLEAASGGTLYLDEIGDLPLDLQARLLQCLQAQILANDNEQIALNVRVMASTRQDLGQAVEQGRFREDLHEYLSALRLEVPPLRERSGDVELLARFFLDKFSREYHLRLRGYSHSALRSLNAYDWPGNVRELINRIRRAMIMAQGQLITPQDLGLNETDNRARTMTLDEARDQAEREVILSCLRRVRNNVSRAARELGVSRVTLYRLLEKHGMTRIGDGA